MTLFQGILLGILQGIAEFLPISSSGHLQIARQLFGLEDIPVLFDIMLHLATLAAVILYFRKKIWKLLKVFFRWIFRKPSNEIDDKTDLLSGTDIIGRKTIIAVLISTFVTGLIGFFTSKLLPELSVKVVCAGFITTSGLLIISSVLQKKRTATIDSDNVKKPVSPIQALVIGFMQGIGTLPGISRSGSTIAGSLLSGTDRTLAGEYSFIVSIPAILGAFLLEIKDLGKISTNVGFQPLIAGCAAAFAWGYIALSLLMKIIKKGKLEWFACYLVPAGILGIIFL